METDIISTDYTNRNHPFFNEDHQLHAEIIELSHEGICIINRRGHFVYANPAFIRLLGFSKLTELVSSGWKDFLDNDSIYFIKRHLLPIINNSFFWQGELKLFKRDRTEFCADSAISALNGSLYSITINDVTQRKKFDHELNNRQLRLTIINFVSQQIISGIPQSDLIKKTFGQVYKYFPNSRITYWKLISGSTFRCEYVKESVINREPLYSTGSEITFDDSFASLPHDGKGFCWVNEKPAAKGKFKYEFYNKAGTSYIQPIFCKQSLTALIQFEFSDGKSKFDDISVLFREISEYFSLAIIKERSIAERDEAIDSFTSSEEKYKKLVESIDDLIFTVSEEGIIESVNSAFERLTGWTKLQIINENILKFLCPASNTHTLLEITGFNPDQNDKLLECKFLTSSNALLDIELKIVPEIISGTVQTLICVGRDITDRKQKEMKMQEQASLIEQIHDAVLVIDDQKMITYSNPSAKNLFEAFELHGRSVYQVFGASVLEQTHIAFEKLKTCDSWTGEFSLTLKSGKKIYVESSWTNVSTSADKPKSVLIINTDLTEKKEMETQFYRKQRMESLGTLSSGIAHDFNNILTPIMISLDILKQKYRDESADHIIDTLLQTVNRGSDLVKKILSFSKGINIKNSIISPAILINDILKIVTETFPKSIIISKEIPDNIWSICGDHTQLDQVFLNICVNARDAMHGKGTLTISVQNISVLTDRTVYNSVLKAGAYVMIAVKDTGDGIDSKIMERIFEPFFTTKPIGKGTGLGLSTSYAIIKSHNGHLSVESEIGKGTTFSIFLPKSDNKAVEILQQKPFEKLLPSDEVILLVDDEPAIIELYHHLLTPYGFKLLSANDGNQAITVFRANKKSITTVITDINMPNLDGYALSKQIKKENRKIKIIGATGNSENSHSAESTVLFDFILEKPFQVSALFEALASKPN